MTAERHSILDIPSSARRISSPHCRAEWESVGHSLEDKHGAIDHLKRTAEEQLQRLLQQERTMSSLQSNLNLLMKRYTMEKSYFSSAADWYGAQPWWAKLLLGLTLVGLGAGFGAIFHVPIAICCGIASLYLIVSFLFINHHNASEKCTKRISEDIIEIEKSLAESVEHLCALETSLKRVMMSLCQMNSHMADDLSQFEKMLDELKKKLTTYHQVIQTLTQANDSLVVNTSRITSTLAHAEAQYSTCHAALAGATGALHHVHDDVTQTNRHLTDDHERLSRVNEQFHQTTMALSTMTSTMQSIVSTLQHRIDDDQPMKKKPHDPLMTTTLASSDDTDEMLVHAHSIASAALTQLSACDEINAKHAVDTKALSAEIEDASKETQHRVARATSILDHRKTRATARGEKSA